MPAFVVAVIMLLVGALTFGATGRTIRWRKKRKPTPSVEPEKASRFKSLKRAAAVIWPRR
jgi:hypothetical protein